MIKCKSLSPWLVLIVPFLVSACESIQEKDLTDPAISNTVNNPFKIDDDSPDQLQFQSEEGTLVDVSLNVSSIDVADHPYYVLSLILHNRLDTAIHITPAVHMADATGMAVRPVSYHSFAGVAHSLASSGRVASKPRSSAYSPSYFSAPSYYYHSGTVTSMQGNVYRYSGYSYSGGSTLNNQMSYASNLGSGLGAAIAGIQTSMKKKEGQRLLQWAETHWIREQYELAPAGSVGAVVAFPAGPPMPLSLTINVAGEAFKFVSGKQ